MAGFRKDKTGVAQTAANASATIVAALVTGGVVKTVAKATEEFDARYASIYASLAEVVDADNAMFEALDAADGGSSGGGRKSSGGARSKGGAVTLDDAMGLTLNFGAFKGLTLAEVLEVSAEEASERTDGKYAKSGRDWVTWLSKNTDPKAKFAAERAKLVIESLRAGSDA